MCACARHGKCLHFQEMDLTSRPSLLLRRLKATNGVMLKAFSHLHMYYSMASKNGSIHSILTEWPRKGLPDSQSHA